MQADPDVAADRIELAMCMQVLAQQAEMRGEMRALKDRLDHLARKQQLDMWLG
jgi:hypothetical protein